MKFLIDADSIIFKAGCSIEERLYKVYADGELVFADPYKAAASSAAASAEANGAQVVEIERTKTSEESFIAIGRMKDMIKKITEHAKCTSYQIFIGGKDNFRKELYPEYKANRDPFFRPICEQDLREYLCHKYKAVVVDGMEVDDMVSYLCMEDPDNTVICAIDKDLDNTPGWHYNYDKDNYYYVDLPTANLNFYCQLLTGDSSDNVPGIPKIGPIKAANIMYGAGSEYEMYERVLHTYDAFGIPEQVMELNAKLLWMMREKDVLWSPPKPF